MPMTHVITAAAAAAAANRLDQTRQHCQQLASNYNAGCIVIACKLPLNAL